MSDIKLRAGTLFEGDFLFTDNDFEMDDGLATAVVISLFTDQRATVDDPLPDPRTTDRRGWWGDKLLPYDSGDEIGSKLWLLERSKTTEQVLSKAEEYAKKSLEWMIKDGIVKSVEVVAERYSYNNNFALALGVTLIKRDGDKEKFIFDDEWTASLTET